MRLKGIVFGLLASLAFAIYLLINRYVYISYDVDGFSYVSTFMIAGGVFAAIGLVYSYSQKTFPIIHKRNLPIIMNGVIAAVGLGIFVFGQAYTTAVNAGILGTSTIITTILYSKLLLKDSLSRNQQFWLAVMFMGLYLAIVGVQSIHLNKGDVIILFASLILGFTNAFSKILMKSHSSNFIADVRLASGGLFFIALGFLIKGTDVIVTSAGLWPLLAGFFFWLTIKFFYAAVQYINPNQAIVIANSHPIFTPLAGVFLLGEPYGWTKFLGSLILMVSIFFINRKSAVVKP